MFNQKKLLLDELSALKILSSNGFPSLREIKSVLLSPKNDSIDFLIELLKLLVGWEKLKSETTNFLTYQTSTIENTIKIFLKSLIRKHFFCNTDGLIPIELITNGFNIQIKSIDVFGLLKINPTSQVGFLVYNQTEDMNSFLYNVINNNDENWKNIVLLDYLVAGVVDGEQKTDVLNIKIHPNYTGLSVNKFLNDFIDSISLFDRTLIINKTLDLMFGAISLRLGKGLNSIKENIEFQEYIKKIINLPDEIIDDSYYSFNSVDLKSINSQLEQRKSGVRYLVSCGNVESSIPYDDIVELTNLLSTNSNLIDIKILLDNQFEVFGKSATNGVNPIDKHLGLLEFFKEYFRNIIVAITELVLSPKILLFFFIYFKIGGLTLNYKNFKDFLLSNRVFIEQLVREIIMPLIIDFLIKIVIKEIKTLIAKDQINKQAEQFKYYQIALKSLFT